MKFLGEDCHDIAFVYLLCPIMLKYLKQKQKPDKTKQKRRSHLEM